MGRVLTIFGAIAVALVLVWRPPAPTPVTVAPQPSPLTAGPGRHAGRATPAAAPVVYVAGAVAHPGLYHLSPGARADDAVRRAGGMRTDADAVGINLAARVSDGDEVLVPVLGSPTPHPGRRPATRRVQKTPADGAVNVNAANAAALATVPGIGATLAARIVEVRERDGVYTDLDQLLDVAGMTQARLERAEPYLRI